MSLEHAYIKLGSALAGFADPNLGFNRNVSVTFFNHFNQQIFNDAQSVSPYFSQEPPARVHEFVADYTLLDSSSHIENMLLARCPNEDDLPVDVWQFGNDFVSVDRFFRSAVVPAVPAMMMTPFGDEAGLREKLIGSGTWSVRPLLQYKQISDDEWLEALDMAGIGVKNELGASKIQDAVERWYTSQAYFSTTFDESVVASSIPRGLDWVATQLSDCSLDFDHIRGEKSQRYIDTDLAFSQFSHKSRYRSLTAKSNPSSVHGAFRVDRTAPILRAELLLYTVRQAMAMHLFRLEQVRASNSVLGSSAVMSVTPSYVLSTCLERAFIKCFSDGDRSAMDTLFSASLGRCEGDIKLASLVHEAGYAFAADTSRNFRARPLGKYLRALRSMDESIVRGMQMFYLPSRVSRNVVRDVYSQVPLVRGVNEAIYHFGSAIVEYAVNKLGWGDVLRYSLNPNERPGIYDLFTYAKDRERVAKFPDEWNK